MDLNLKDEKITPMKRDAFLLAVKEVANDWKENHEETFIKVEISTLTSSSIIVDLFVCNIKDIDTKKMDINYATCLTIINNATSCTK